MLENSILSHFSDGNDRERGWTRSVPLIDRLSAPPTYALSRPLASISLFSDAQHEYNC